MISNDLLLVPLRNTTLKPLNSDSTILSLSLLRDMGLYVTAWSLMVKHARELNHNTVTQRGCNSGYQTLNMPFPVPVTLSYDQCKDIIN